MPITKDEALEMAAKQSSGRMKDRLEIVDRMDGTPYMPSNFNAENYWIIFVPSEQLRTGGSNYTLVHKETGEIRTATT